MKHYALAALLALSTPFAIAAPPGDVQVDQLLRVMRAPQSVEALLAQIQASRRQMVQQLVGGSR